MNGKAHTPGVGQVLGEGWDVFTAGLGSVFPWVLAAELITLLPFANPPGGIFTTDSSDMGGGGFWMRALVFGGVQAFLYGVAVQRLAAQPGVAGAARATPVVLFAYIVYEAVIIIGLVLTFAVFMLGMFIAGWEFGLVLCVLPLAPTAAASTAMALFIFPAVLERRGPFASLSESTRLTKLSRFTWVKVSLVISVPAIALLAAAVVGDMPGIRHAVALALDLQQRAMEGGLSTDQLLPVLDGLKPSAPPDRYGAWSVAGVLLGALAWWYTLAVCYAQYRDLKAAEKS
ncbi:MAG TPA: hypothetical protein VLV87_06760 [Gammaproteobacteria bacterium]|nr:hypothetical protein [Gammaproteobacteria bacterium]